MALLACVQRRPATAAALVVLVLAAGPGCRGGNDEAKAGVAATPPATADESFAEAPSPYDALPPAVREAMDKSFTGDLDGMIERRVIRAGVTFNRTHYFIDKGQQRGATYEAVKLFEDELNKAAKTGKLKVNLVFVPLPRDQLYKALIDGKVDFVAAMVTVTPEREKLVAFSEPTRKGVNQVLVTGPGAPPIASLDDLAGREVFIRKSSLYARQRRRPERPVEGARQTRRDHPRGARGLRRRRRARDGERRPGGRHDRRRLPREILESGIHGSHRPQRHPAAHRRHPGGRDAKGEPEAPRKPSTPGSGSTGRATRFATRSSSGISRTSSTPGTRRQRPNARSSARLPTCSRNTARNTTWTSC